METNAETFSLRYLQVQQSISKYNPVYDSIPLSKAVAKQHTDTQSAVTNLVAQTHPSSRKQIHTCHTSTNTNRHFFALFYVKLGPVLTLTRNSLKHTCLWLCYKMVSHLIEVVVDVLMYCICQLLFFFNDAASCIIVIISALLWFVGGQYLLVLHFYLLHIHVFTHSTMNK